jgi:hypothetical protein
MLGGTRVDLNLVDPEDVPLPRDEVRLRQLAVTPLGDGRRLRIDVALTPFLERPNLDLDVVDSAGESLVRTTVVEADSPSFSLTMHLRGKPQTGEYRVRGALSYASSPPQDVREERFVVELSADDSG